MTSPYIISLIGSVFSYSRLNPYSLLVALDKDGISFGSLFIDDGEELNSITESHYTLVTFQAKPVITLKCI